MFFADTAAAPTLDSVAIQYGCFGLLAMLVLWSMKWGIPGAIAMHYKTVMEVAASHERAVTALVDAFKDDAAECRNERTALARQNAEDRDKDRVQRHDDRERYQVILNDLAAKLKWDERNRGGGP